MASKYQKHFTEEERQYIRRVAGKVPARVMADQIGRQEKNVYNWAHRNRLSLRVPNHIMNKYWRGNGKGTKSAEAEEMPDM